MAILDRQTFVSRCRGLLSGRRDAVEQIGEYLPTFATEFIVLISQLLTFKLAAHLLGVDGFSEYTVARRTIMLIYPIAMLGLGVGLPRYIGRATVSSDSSLSARYLATAVVSIGATTVLSLALLNLFKPAFAYLFFGDSAYANLIFPLGLMLLGLNVHGIVYGYFRGRLAMKRANLIQLINLGMVPPLAFVVFRGNINHVLEGIGIFTSLVAFCALVFAAPLENLSIRSTEARELLHYSLQRVPADFAQFALFALPATFATHVRGLQEGGFVAFGVSVLTMMGALFSPIGIILLPRASQMFADGRQDSLRRHVMRIVKYALVVSIAITLLIELFSKPLVNFYLGPSFAPLSSVIRALGWGAVPYALYCILRSLLDAYYNRALNTINNAIALAVFLACSSLSLILKSPFVVPLSLVGSLVVLGILTVKNAGSILKPDATQGFKSTALEFERS
jgi:O-antigen/teichoic acid export membrane protein